MFSTATIAAVTGLAVVPSIFSLNPALADDPPPVFPSPGNPPSRGTGDGASRGDDCPETGLPMMSMVPTLTQGGWSTDVNPAVWVYIPFELTPDYEVKFTFRDPQGQTMHQAWLYDLSTEPGVLSFAVPSSVTLPETPADMADPEVWSWSVSVFCDPAGGRPEVASGGIRRVDEAVAMPETTSPLAISEAYVQSGVWYDALTTLGNARRENPDDAELEAAWQTLLNYSTVGLEAIANEPLVDCCTLFSE
ncbi:MAG: DUF928 domain-containing protein [Elainellaceae cyanobacterium]